jgi:hypothetical protein
MFGTPNPKRKEEVLMSKNPTLTTLDNCAVSYAKAGVTKTGNTMVTGLIRQNSAEGYFQTSANFACFDSAVQEQLLRIASKIEDAGQTVENTGTSADDQKAGLSVTLTGYFQTKKPKDDGKWYTSFIVTEVGIKNSIAIENESE